jgi:hypothetical protein
MGAVMKTIQTLVFACVGWVSGLLATLGLSGLLPKILPVTDRVSAVEGSWKFLPIVLVLVTPAALVGGVVGSKLVKEGGRREQIIYAILFGIIFTLPFAACILWYTGW